MEELWKPWVESDTHLVSNMGRVKNAKTGKVFKNCIDRYGYFKLSLTVDGKRMYRTVHRMVGMTWLPNPDNKPQINHKNGVKRDNFVGNLEWSTVSENIAHSFELSLNNNKFSATLEDLETGVIEKHRSLKKIARLLDTHVSVLIPLMRRSKDYPILGRYVITVEDEEILKNPYNTQNSGIPIYVFDWVDGSVTKYNSTLIAAYFTGLRCLAGIKGHDTVINGLGYTVSRDLNLLPVCPTVTDPTAVILGREAGLSREWCRRDYRFILYDYYNREELLFDTVSDLIDFLDSTEPLQIKITRSSVSDSVHGSKTGTNRLIKGFGVNTDKHDRVWTNFNEEVILSSRHGCLAPNAVYRVIKNGVEELVFGKSNLCRALGYRIDGSESYPVLNRLIDSYSAPNVSVIRLNSPIFKDEDMI